MSKTEDITPVSEEPEELADPNKVEQIVNSEIDKKTVNVGRSVARSAGIVSVFVMLSRIFGLVREVVFAALFGASVVKDAFTVAFRIPNLLRDLFAEGALSVAFVKVFTDYQVNVSEKEAWRLAALVFNTLAVILSGIVLIGIIFAPLLVSIIAKDFTPEKVELAVWLTRIMFAFILFVSLSAVAMGVLNTKGNFAIPASASTAFNIVSILAGMGLAYYLSGGEWSITKDENLPIPINEQWAITGMALGTLFGGLAQFAIQLPSLYKVGFRFKPLLSFTDKGLQRVMRLMGPAIIGTSAVQIKVLVDSAIVSGSNGGMSWLGYSFRLMQFPIGVFGVAIGVAALPTLARLGSEGNIVKFRSTLSNSLGLVFLLTIPSACGLIVLGEPIIRLIYERGAFTPNDTMMASLSLAAYSVGLAGYAAIKVLSPSFFALEDAKTPMYVSLASIIIHVFLSYSLFQYFSNVGVTPTTPDGYGHVGVALATSIVATSNFLALTFLMRRKIKRIEARKIISSFVKIAFASVMLSVVCWFSYQYLTAYFVEKGFLVKLIETFIPITLGGIIFLICAKLLRIRELDQFVNIFKNKFGRKKP
jgi:putative peptidoglycan lipid II flippase